MLYQAATLGAKASAPYRKRVHRSLNPRKPATPRTRGGSRTPRLHKPDSSKPGVSKETADSLARHSTVLSPPRPVDEVPSFRRPNRSSGHKRRVRGTVTGPAKHSQAPTSLELADELISFDSLFTAATTGTLGRGLSHQLPGEGDELASILRQQFDLRNRAKIAARRRQREEVCRVLMPSHPDGGASIDTSLWRRRNGLIGFGAGSTESVGDDSSSIADTQEREPSATEPAVPHPAPGDSTEEQDASRTHRAMVVVSEPGIVVGSSLAPPPTTQQRSVHPPAQLRAHTSITLPCVSRDVEGDNSILHAPNSLLTRDSLAEGSAATDGSAEHPVYPGQGGGGGLALYNPVSAADAGESVIEPRGNGVAHSGSSEVGTGDSGRALQGHDQPQGAEAGAHTSPEEGGEEATDDDQVSELPFFLRDSHFQGRRRYRRRRYGHRSVPPQRPPHGGGVQVPRHLNSTPHESPGLATMQPSGLSMVGGPSTSIEQAAAAQQRYADDSAQHREAVASIPRPQVVENDDGTFAAVPAPSIAVLGSQVSTLLQGSVERSEVVISPASHRIVQEYRATLDSTQGARPARLASATAPPLAFNAGVQHRNNVWGRRSGHEPALRPPSSLVSYDSQHRVHTRSSGMTTDVDESTRGVGVSASAGRSSATAWSIGRSTSAQSRPHASASKDGVQSQQVGGGSSAGVAFGERFAAVKRLYQTAMGRESTVPNVGVAPGAQQATKPGETPRQAGMQSSIAFGDVAHGQGTSSGTDREAVRAPVPATHVGPFSTPHRLVRAVHQGSHVAPPLSPRLPLSRPHRPPRNHPPPQRPQHAKPPRARAVAPARQAPPHAVRRANNSRPRHRRGAGSDGVGRPVPSTSPLRALLLDMRPPSWITSPFAKRPIKRGRVPHPPTTLPAVLPTKGGSRASKSRSRCKSRSKSRSTTASGGLGRGPSEGALHGWAHPASPVPVGLDTVFGAAMSEAHNVGSLSYGGHRDGSRVAQDAHVGSRLRRTSLSVSVAADSPFTFVASGPAAHTATQPTSAKHDQLRGSSPVAQRTAQHVAPQSTPPQQANGPRVQPQASPSARGMTRRGSALSTTIAGANSSFGVLWRGPPPGSPRALHTQRKDKERQLKRDTEGRTAALGPLSSPSSSSLAGHTRRLESDLDNVMLMPQRLVGQLDRFGK